MIRPLESISTGAHVRSLEQYRAMYDRSLQDPEGFWAEQAERLTWFRRWGRVVHDDFSTANMRWFERAHLNVCHNCVDRHLPKRAQQAAIIWAGDHLGDYRHITYQELHDDVCRLANVLLQHGVKKGDRVAIYMPMIPELAYAMLACARIGAIHSVVFAGFSAEALRDRIVDADCRIVLTANEGVRGGRKIPLKATVDRALRDTNVRTVLVAQRTEVPVPMTPGRDFDLAQEMARHRSYCPVEVMDAESPLFVLYTSGSTGKPKGLMHTSAGYLLFAALTHEIVFDYRPGDVYCCAADVGWITGHSYIVYGPLANGATTVMFESVPTWPDPGRYWRLVDDLQIAQFYTAPTALRAIAKAGDEWVRKHSRRSLRVLGSVGEPINPEVWQWYHDVVGEKRCAVVDTWWQTETGGHMITPLPGATPTKPGSATLPFFGVRPVLVDDDGNELHGNDVAGNLCLRGSWPGQARTIWNDHERFHQTYFGHFHGLYFTGDGCRRDADGYYWITGRVDDVLNVSGHRLGTAEIESALVAHVAVAEAAVVGIPHELKGQGICAFVQLAAGHECAEDDQRGLLDLLRELVREAIGPIATPDRIQLVPGLPKTRSGKIMRRILRKIAHGEYEQLGDITTLADPSVVASIVAGHRDAEAR
ncbi:MAG: acetate--CoA ligase [Planctomycetes bacterium]|nr:acetate--CoA ligase [Planctomycetota bacterium]